MADSVVRSFKALETKRDRLDALQKLVQILDHDECTVTATAISRRRDVFFALPTELVSQIFNYLEILDTWRLQRVCKHWREGLSSDDFLRAAVSRWQTHDESDSARSSDLDTAATIQQNLRHMQANTSAKPFTTVVFDNTGTGPKSPQPNLGHRKVDLKGHRIAYMSTHYGQDDTVIVRDLITGERSTLRGEARERIICFVLTTTLVAFITYDASLYSYKFSESASLGEAKCVRLPSSLIRACAGDNDDVALAMGSDRWPSPYVTEVLLFNAKDMKLRSIDAEEGFEHLEEGLQRLRSNSCGILVNSARQTIDVFELESKTDNGISRREAGNIPKCLLILHMRLSFSGDTLQIQSWTQAGYFDTSLRNNHFQLASPAPIGIRDLFRIQICEIPFMGGLPLRHSFSVLFDIVEGRFLPEQETKVSADHQLCSSGGSGVSPGGGKLAEKADHGAIRVLWKNRLHRPPLVDSSWMEYILLMNDTFMLSLEVNKDLLQHSRIRVLCSDEQIEMAGAHTTGLWDDGLVS